MQEQYLEVPSNILTGKDLDYLSDMFQWNYGAYKKAKNSASQVNDEEIASVLEKGATLFDQNIQEVLEILSTIGGASNE